MLLSGEPGVGKSRIVRTVCERVEGEPHLRLRYQCSPYHSSTAFHPFVEQLERAAGFARDDTPAAKLDKLEALLAQGTARVGEVAPLLAAMLSIPTDGRYPPLAHGPERQRELTVEALVEQLLGLARQQPVLCAFEDLHWADPSTLDVLDPVIDRIGSARVLLLLTCRPEFAPPWRSRSRITTHSLSRLAPRQSAALAERVTGGKRLPPEVLEEIVARTDGVPLFIEELTKTVLESGLLRDAGDRYVTTGPLPPPAIPSTLHDSLMARLDRSAPMREVAQVGAAIGREFPHDLLAAVAPTGGDALDAALGELVASGLVTRHGTPPHAVYTFKHALVQDAAYQSLLKGKRRPLHARVADVLEQRFPGTAEAQPELLARHFAEAGLPARAIGYWRQAGERALARSGTKEALAHLASGLAALEGLPQGAERQRLEVELRLALGRDAPGRQGHRRARDGGRLPPGARGLRAVGRRRGIGAGAPRLGAVPLQPGGPGHARARRARSSWRWRNGPATRTRCARRTKPSATSRSRSATRPPRGHTWRRPQHSPPPCGMRPTPIRSLWIDNSRARSSTWRGRSGSLATRIKRRDAAAMASLSPPVPPTRSRQRWPSATPPPSTCSAAMLASARREAERLIALARAKGIPSWTRARRVHSRAGRSSRKGRRIPVSP